MRWILMAAVVCSLGLSFAACSDDDDNKSEEQKEQEAQVKSSNFWNVVGQLVSVDDVTDDYEGKTFEPTYGLPDGNNITTRIVNTNDMKTAAQRFANLVDVKGIDENTPSYTWSDPEIGSMTYTRGGTPAEWATVDVNIKAVPRLQRIIYREGGEGTNGKFSGKAYYRFGDVVKRDVTVKFDQKKNNDNRQTITEYWICVRPAFGPEGKEDSHWVCVNTVGDKNYKYYKASTGTEYWLPTSMGTDKEDMQNFAELLYAICNPATWEKNIQDHHTDGTLWGFSGVPFFTDFKKAHLHLHNQFFWQNVQNGWRKAQVPQLALNMTDINELISEVGNNGVHLLYKGYSWWFTTSWDCELYEAAYTNGTKNEELNLHHAEYKEVEKNMKNLKFDVREMGKTTTNYNDFFNGDRKIRWAIRHATGKELSANKSYDPKQPLNGVEQVYRYYDNVLPMPDLSEAPESPELVTDKYLLGYLIGKDCKFYKDAAEARKARTEPVAVVVYVGDKFVENNRQDPAMKHYNGLAISINRVNGMEFSSEITPDGVCYYNCDDYGDFYNIRNGLKQIECFVNAKCRTGKHIGGHYNTNNFSPNLQKIDANFSPWFIPSVGQWVMVLREYGYTWNGTSANFGNIGEGYKNWTKILSNGGIQFSTLSVMTCTEKNATEFYSIRLDNSSAKFETKNKKGELLHAYAFTAFTFGEGAIDSDLVDRYLE